MTTTRSAGKPLPRGELGSGTPAPAAIILTMIVHTLTQGSSDQQQTILHFPSVYPNHQQLANTKILQSHFSLHLPSSCLSGPATSCCTLCKRSSAQSELITILSIRSGAAAKRGGATPVIFHIPWSGPGPVTLSTDICRGYPA